MYKPFEAFVGLRYVRAKRRNHFISFISLISMLGVGVGVMALITVLSVMNGFEKELKERILGMAAHATVVDYDGDLQDWRSVAAEVQAHPQVTGVAPYFRAEGMLVFEQRVQPSIIRGILPEEEPKVSVIADRMQSGDFAALKPGEFGIILGVEAARTLGVTKGDRITLIVPQANITPAGLLPRLKRFTVVGTFEVGMGEFDSGLALVHLNDALKLFRKTGPGGLRLKTTDILLAPVISREVMETIPGRYGVIDWTQRHSNFFKALKTEKTVMFVILTLIVAVAAFNIISTLVMVVSDKRADIAVLRTLGATPGSIMRIFMLQGTLIGLVGIVLGSVAGVALAGNVETIVPAIESWFETDFLDANVYYISDLPSDLRWKDVIVINLVSFVFSIGATIYPALRAAQVKPAEALRYE
ncbi:MAG: lipoprotein-releasing ABC transporter permease subunit [Gammaproteobacteria bacterium]